MSIHELPQTPRVRRAYQHLLKVVREALDGEDVHRPKAELRYLKRSVHNSSLFPRPGTRVPRPSAPLDVSKKTFKYF
jgi:hypothetical protein